MDLDNIQIIIDNLRSDIRTRNNFDPNETMKTIIVPKYFKEIIKYQRDLAENGNNVLQFQILCSKIPYKILIKRDAVKTILTNLISINLRKIRNSIVNIKIELEDFDSQEIIKDKWTTIGCDNITNKNFIVVEIKHTSLEFEFSFKDLDLVNVIQFNTFVHLCN